MVRRLQEQQAQKQNQPTEIEESTSASSVLTSTPKDSKFTQTSRPSSPVMSPITLSEMKNLQGNGKEGNLLLNPCHAWKSSSGSH